jgi:hypothetical protein
MRWIVKLHVLALSLLVCGAKLIAQGYIPTFVESKIWVAENYWTLANPLFGFSQQITGDTLVEGLTYNVIETFFQGYPYLPPEFIREDVYEQRIYRYLQDEGFEWEIVDFTLEEDDVFTTYGDYGFMTFEVTQVDSVEYNSLWRKKIVLHQLGIQPLANQVTWIEGVGVYGHYFADYSLQYSPGYSDVTVFVCNMFEFDDLIIETGNCLGTYIVPQVFGDFNSSGDVTIDDLLMLMADYGCTGICSADLILDGTVGVGDVLGFITAFGE